VRSHSSTGGNDASRSSSLLGSLCHQENIRQLVFRLRSTAIQRVPSSAILKSVHHFHDDDQRSRQHSLGQLVQIVFERYLASFPALSRRREPKVEGEGFEDREEPEDGDVEESWSERL
jgi:hypothetical protein